MDYVSVIREEIMRLNQSYIDNSLDNYNFFENYLKFIVKEAKLLAEKYNVISKILFDE